MSESDPAVRPEMADRRSATAPGGTAAAPRRRRWLGWAVLGVVLCGAAATVWLAVERSRSAADTAVKGPAKTAGAEKAAGADKGSADGKSAAPAEGRRVIVIIIIINLVVVISVRAMIIVTVVIIGSVINVAEESNA